MDFWFYGRCEIYNSRGIEYANTDIIALVPLDDACVTRTHGGLVVPTCIYVYILSRIKKNLKCKAADVFYYAVVFVRGQPQSRIQAISTINIYFVMIDQYFFVFRLSLFSYKRKNNGNRIKIQKIIMGRMSTQRCL